MPPISSARPGPLSQRIFAPASAPLPAVGDGLRWRPARPSDAPALHTLRALAGLIDHPTYAVSVEEIHDDLTAPLVDLERDSAVAVDASGAIVAVGLVIETSGRETLVRVILEGCVHPQWRGRGIGTALLAWQEARGTQVLARSDETLPGWLLAHSQADAPTRSLLTAHGYAERRWWFELERDLAVEVPAVALDPALRLEGYGPDWAVRTLAARNEVFRDHWGSQPTSLDDWLRHDALPSTRADLSWLATAPDGDEDEVVGFVLAETVEESWAVRGRSVAYITYVGVRREWRGRKVAQALVSHALAGFRAVGLELAALDVDSESPTGALGLYESLGFAPASRSVSLVKEF